MELNVSADHIVVIVDSFYIYIEAGLNADVTAICVLTSEITVNDIDSGNIKLNFEFESAMEIYYHYNDYYNK